MIVIQDKNGKDVEVFVADNGGFIDCTIRATSEIAWTEGAVYYGLLVQTEDKELVPAKGVHIDILGPVVIKDAVYDGMKATEPASIDDRYHLNLRLSNEALEKEVDGYPKWKQMAINWTTLGTLDVNNNADEQGRILSNVCLIDPSSIKSPTRIWL